MEDKKNNNAEPDEMEKGKKKKTEEDLPYCTTAPSAEHYRADDEDEPCDDGRTGEID